MMAHSSNKDFSGDPKREVEEIIQATEVAAQKILKSCENITLAAQALPESEKQSILREVTTVLEACTFQDIVGQRAQNALSVMGEASKSSSKPVNKNLHEGELLSGPQLPGQGVSQEEVDKILSE